MFSCDFYLRQRFLNSIKKSAIFLILVVVSMKFLDVFKTRLVHWIDIAMTFASRFAIRLCTRYYWYFKRVSDKMSLFVRCSPFSRSVWKSYPPKWRRSNTKIHFSSETFESCTRDNPKRLCVDNKPLSSATVVFGGISMSFAITKNCFVRKYRLKFDVKIIASNIRRLPVRREF